MDARDGYTVVVGKPEKWEHFGLVGINRCIIRN
jgi:hypothetical protein